MLRWAVVLLLAWRVVLAGADWREPVIGGPCEGCENVFVGMPDRIPHRARIASEHEPGQPMVIEGVVTSPDGDPVPGVIVYAYHTDQHGVYPDGETRHGSLRGWARSDDQGRYTFDTIRPASYPNSTVSQHVHMHVVEPGRVTYYITNLEFDDDPLLTERRRAYLERGRGGSGLTHPVRDQDGVWHVRRDIILGKNVPGYEG